MRKLDCILLVDDDDITNFVHESIITSTEVTEKVLIAKNGLEALTLIREEKNDSGRCPGLIFMDINMPVMNGFEFLEAYHRLEDDLRDSVIVVMLSTSLNPKDIEKTKERGVADFLNKPLTSNKLLEVVQKHF